MTLFEIVKDADQKSVEESFVVLKARADYSYYSKSEAAHFLQPVGKTLVQYMYDFYFKTGDCVSYFVKEHPSDVEIRRNGVWSIYVYEERVWYVYEDGEFVLDESHRHEKMSLE